MKKFRETLFLFGAVVVSVILVSPSVCALPSPELGLKNIEKDGTGIEDLPDLTVSIERVEIYIIPRQILLGKPLMPMNFLIILKNEGNAVAYVGSLITSFIFEENGVAEFEIPYDLSEQLDVEYLKPSQERLISINTDDMGYEKNPPLLKDIRVIVDSENLIEELDEDNNDDLFTWPYFIDNLKFKVNFFILYLKMMLSVIWG